MDGSTRCAFCDHPRPADRLRREFELDFCERCAGDLDAVVAVRRARGDQVQVREWTTVVPTPNGTRTFYNLEVSGVPRSRIPARARFTREGAWEKLKKLFAGEVEVGDPLFDDFIYVSTADRDATAGFLRHPGVQSILIDLLAGHKHVVFEHGAVTAFAQDVDPLESTGALRAICALLVHVERMAPAVTRG